MPDIITVLAAEDDDDDADLLALALAQAKDRTYEIRRLRSLAAFFDQTPLIQPDIVLLDLHLPDSQGIETVRRALARRPGVPVVVLTGSESDEVGLRAVEAGAQDFVPKPELMSPLVSRVIDLAIRRRETAQRKRQRWAG